MKIQEINTKSYITKSKLPASDFVVNPYVGCPHKCIYCYAEFMKRFTNHEEDWGEFLDVKRCSQLLLPRDIKAGESVLFGSVTDAYNPYESKYKVTRSILENLVDCTGHIEILTKSDLILRDIDIIKKIKDIAVGISMNSTDDRFRAETEPRASSVEKRINALRILKENGIKTYLFMSPIFPEISDWICLIEKTRDYFDYVCFENLNLRGGYKPRVLNYIANKYPQHMELYNSIYRDAKVGYWVNLEQEIIAYCTANGLDYRMYFYHEKIKKGGTGGN